MAWKHDVDHRMKNWLGQAAFRIERETAVKIIQDATEHFHLEEITLQTNDRPTTSLYGRAKRKRGHAKTTYTIEMFPRGMDTVSLLHEIAHCFPDGYDHHIGWTFSFFLVCNWFRAVWTRYANMNIQLRKEIEENL